jgi:hypothetical protein
MPVLFNSSITIERTIMIFVGRRKGIRAKKTPETTREGVALVLPFRASVLIKKRERTTGWMRGVWRRIFRTKRDRPIDPTTGLIRQRSEKPRSRTSSISERLIQASKNHGHPGATGSLRARQITLFLSGRSLQLVFFDFRRTGDGSLARCDYLFVRDKTLVLTSS